MKIVIFLYPVSVSLFSICGGLQQGTTICKCLLLFFFLFLFCCFYYFSMGVNHFWALLLFDIVGKKTNVVLLKKKKKKLRVAFSGCQKRFVGEGLDLSATNFFPACVRVRVRET